MDWVGQAPPDFCVASSFRLFKYVCIKKFTYKISARFHIWPKGLVIETTKTEKFSDRNGSDKQSDRINLTEMSCAEKIQSSALLVI